jgi:hypothetical protein
LNPLQILFSLEHSFIRRGEGKNHPVIEGLLSGFNFFLPNVNMGPHNTIAHGSNNDIHCLFFFHPKGVVSEGNGAIIYQVLYLNINRPVIIRIPQYYIRGY